MLFANPAGAVASRALHPNNSAPAGVNRTKVPLSCITSPAALDGELHARAVLGGASLVLEQERPVDQLDVDASVLHRLDGAGDLDDAACGFRRRDEVRRISCVALKFRELGTRKLRQMPRRIRQSLLG